MKRTILRISSISLFSLGIWLSYDLLQPIRSSTSALDEEITLQSDAKKYFQTDFHYNYGVDITIETPLTSETIENIEIQIKNRDRDLIKAFNGIIDKTESTIRLGNFNASSGDQLELIIKNLSPGLKGKNAIFKIDVTGGGPSVGLALAKGLKPYLWSLAGIFGVIALITGYFGFRNQQVTNAETP